MLSQNKLSYDLLIYKVLIQEIYQSISVRAVEVVYRWQAEVGKREDRLSSILTLLSGEGEPQFCS